MTDSDTRRRSKCFIYCRTSVDSESKDSSDKVSIEEQEINGRKLARKHDLEVVDVFIDRNRSSRVYPTGYSIPDPAVDEYCRQCNFSERQRTRESLGKMISRLDEVGIVIVRDQDRLMRPELLSYLDTHLLNLFRKAGVVIMSRDGSTIDPSKSRDVISARTKGSSDSDTYDKRREETINALKELRDSGMPYSSTTFYGFRYVGTGKPPKRIDSEVKVIQRIFQDFINSNNIAQIVQTLNAERIPSPETHVDKNKVKGDGPFWNISTVREILRRIRYAGFQYRTDGSEVDTPYFLPPVIDRETFDKVQALFEKRSHDPQGRDRAVHALSGLVRCGYCHYNMQIVGNNTKGSNSVKLRYFRCKKVRDTAGRTGCSTASIRERMPKALVENEQVSPAMAHGIEDCLYPLIYKGIYDLNLARTRRDGLEQEILDAEKELNRLRQKIIEADGDEFRKIHGQAADIMLGQRTKEFNAIGQRLEQLQREMDNSDFESIPIPTFDDFASARIDEMTKKVYFRRVIDHVDVFEDLICVYLQGTQERSFTLYREYSNGSGLLPKWELVPTEFNSHDAVASEGNPPDIKRMLIQRKPRTKYTAYHIVYRYQSPGPIQVVFGDQDLVVVAEGHPIRKQ